MLRALRAIGLIVPSSNRVVERITAEVLGDVVGVSAHSTRVKSQEYTRDDVRWAAALLAHTRMDAICWSATKGDARCAPRTSIRALWLRAGEAVAEE